MCTANTNCEYKKRAIPKMPFGTMFSWGHTPPLNEQTWHTANKENWLNCISASTKERTMRKIILFIIFWMIKYLVRINCPSFSRTMRPWAMTHIQTCFTLCILIIIMCIVKEKIIFFWVHEHGQCCKWDEQNETNWIIFDDTMSHEVGLMDHGPWT